MKKELQEKLIKKYPNIFSDVGKSPSESGMAFGVQTGDGWLWLIDNLCNELNKYKIQNETPIKVFQVKEKFGGLRFYLTGGGIPEQYAIIEFAQSLSFSICEICGSTENVKQTKDSYIQTLCDKCENKNNVKKT